MPPPPPATQVEFTVLHDARAVHDAASLCLDDYEPSGRPSWILATVSPDAQSGSATVPGGYFEADTGKLVVPSGAQTSLIKSGNWSAIASAPLGAHPSHHAYSWYEPLVRKRTLLVEDHYSPFVHGGTVLFQPHLAKTDLEQFGAACLIFPDWAAKVPAAFAFHEANPHLLDPGPQTAAVAKLVQLVSDPNPLLAVVAFRNLLALGLAQPDWVRAQLVRVSGPLGAVFGYLTIVIAGPNVSRPFANETLQVIDTAAEPTLRALVLGSFAAALLPTGNPAIEVRARSVLGKAKQRLGAAGVVVAKDPQLSLMFDRAGV